jgi:hypothetical protein
MQPSGGTPTVTEVSIDATDSLAVIKKQFPGVRIKRAGKLLVVTPKDQPQDGYCALGALTSADTYISVTTTEGSGPSVLCPPDRAVLADLVGTVGSGRLQHFARWPANSTGQIRACSVMTMAEAVRALPAVNATFNLVDGHSCVYERGNGPTSVYFATYLDSRPDTLASLRAQWMAGKDRYPGTSVVLDGRRTLIGPSLGTTLTEDHSCLAETDGRVWPHGFGNDAASEGRSKALAFTEVPTVLLIDASLPLATLCEGAALLARAIWPRLPR